MCELAVQLLLVNASSDGHFCTFPSRPINHPVLVTSLLVYQIYTMSGKMEPFLSRVSILTRDIDIANLSICSSVCPSVTFRYQIKTA